MGYPFTVTPSRLAPLQDEQPDRVAAEHQGMEKTINVHFAGGTDRSFPPHMVPEKFCWDMLNMYFPREAAIPQTRPGAVQLQTGDALPGYPVAMHVYQKTTTTSYVVVACYNAAGTSLELYYLDGSYAKVKIGDLGTLNTVVPTFLTFGGRLLIAQAGEWIKEWAGETGGSPAKATGTITLTALAENLPVADETVTVGNRVYTWKSARVLAGEVTIGGSLADCATNLAAAINADSTTVDAVASTVTVTATAKSTGAEGNLLTLVDGSAGNCVPSGATLSGGGVGVKANGTITMTAVAAALPVAGDTVTIGARTYTWQTLRSQAGEVTIGASANACATNLVAAITTDSWDLSAVANSAVVTVTATRTGTGGNSLALTDGSGGHCVPSAANMAGGVNGLTLDQISTYLAPKPGIVNDGLNTRVVAAGDTRDGYVDRIYFSAPGNAFSWADADYGSGEYADLGSGEGNTVSAVVPYLNELMVHKSGQNKKMYRIAIPTPDPSSWTISTKHFSAHTAALNSRCALTVADKHLALDNRVFRVFQGNDQYDEIASALDGLKVYDFLDRPTTSAFFVLNPDEMYVLCFPLFGANAIVFHYGTKRWSRWAFNSREFRCGAYSVALNKFLLADSDGFVYWLDPSVATDDGLAYISAVIGRVIGGDSLYNVRALHAIIDYKNILTGSGYLGLLINRVETDIQTLTTFSTLVGGTLLYDATGELYSATGDLYEAIYGRKATFTQGGGETISPYIQLSTGAFALNSLLMRVAYQGRSGK